MDLSSRVMSIQPSPTLAVNAKANELRAAGVDVINFGAGQSDFPTPKHVCEAAKQAIDEGFTRYTPVDGIPELKQAVIDKFQKDNGLSYSMDQVMVNVGGKHSSYLIMQALINPGDEVIVPAPYWVSYPPMVILAGGVPVVVNTKAENDFKLTPAELAGAITDKTKAVFFNFPSNPTGGCYSKEELVPLVEACVAKGILMISDEMYESIYFWDKPFTSVAAVTPGAYDYTVTLNGVSKSHSMTGWRIGYMGGPKDLVRACAKVQSQSTSNPCAIAQRAALAALTGPQDHLPTHNEEFRKRRDYMMGRIKALPGVSCIFPEGAFYTFPDVSSYYGKSVDGKKIDGSLDMAAYLLEGAHVAAVPGVAFGEEACVRFSYALAMAEIVEGMNRVEAALAKLA